MFSLPILLPLCVVAPMTLWESRSTSKNSKSQSATASKRSRFERQSNSFDESARDSSISIRLWESRPVCEMCLPWQRKLLKARSPLSFFKVNQEQERTWSPRPFITALAALICLLLQQTAVRAPQIKWRAFVLEKKRVLLLTQGRKRKAF